MIKTLKTIALTGLFTALPFNFNPDSIKNLAKLYPFEVKIEENQAQARDWEIPYLFESPRDGKFKTIPWNHEKWDRTTPYHLGGSAGLTIGFNSYLNNKNSKNPALKSAGISFGLGLLKETEDGFREGFSSRDLAADALEVAAGTGIYYRSKWLINKIK